MIVYDRSLLGYHGKTNNRTRRIENANEKEEYEDTCKSCDLEACSKRGSDRDQRQRDEDLWISCLRLRVSEDGFRIEGRSHEQKHGIVRPRGRSRRGPS